MIISASYKTDIPAFYGDWFKARLKAGYCMMTNPYNRKQSIRVSLSMSDVDGFVFWTKNVSPFMAYWAKSMRLGSLSLFSTPLLDIPEHLKLVSLIRRRPPRWFAPYQNDSAPKGLSGGMTRLSFRRSLMVSFHRENFTKLADSLAGSTDEVVVSFMQVYQKTRRNMNDSAAHNRFSWKTHLPNSNGELSRRSGGYRCYA